MTGVYLKDIPLEEARTRFWEALARRGLAAPIEEEEVGLDQALGRVTSRPVWARISSPHYHSAAMDGYALRAADIAGASDRSPIELDLGPRAVYVDTGDAIPDWADVVVPIEAVEPVGETEAGRATRRIRIRDAVSPWTHVRAMGEDMVATELVLASGHTLRPVDLGAAAGCGHSAVWVRRRPRVAVIPSGSELVPPGPGAPPGRIIEFNSLVLSGQVTEWGGLAIRHPIVPDDRQMIREAVIRAALSSDLILLNAGSSAGSEDFTAQVVDELGELLVHGVAVRPGHPVILGMVRADGPPDAPQPGRWVPIIGVPGFPVSAALTGEIFVEPLLANWLGRPPKTPPQLQAVMTRKVHSSAGDDEYLRVTLARVGDRLVATPLARGAGVLTSLVRADGIVLIPAGVQGIQAGETVTVQLYRSAREVENTILALGSHDMTLDLLAQHLAQRSRRLASGNVGSLGGLVALRRGEAHLAGSHLLDPATGEFNLPYLAQYLPDRRVVVVTFVQREQGLILAAGNPRSVRGLEDLARAELTFVNRQRGSGTRILLDYHLEGLHISPEAISGYAREEYTHLAVAAAVASGRADVGLGIHAAAAALGLDFIPLFQERYDLIIPEEYAASPLLAPLMDVLHEPGFQAEVAALPGYDVRRMGNRML